MRHGLPDEIEMENWPSQFPVAPGFTYQVEQADERQGREGKMITMTAMQAHRVQRDDGSRIVVLRPTSETVIFDSTTVPETFGQ